MVYLMYTQVERCGSQQELVPLQHHVGVRTSRRRTKRRYVQYSIFQNTSNVKKTAGAISLAHIPSFLIVCSFVYTFEADDCQL